MAQVGGNADITNTPIQGEIGMSPPVIPPLVSFPIKFNTESDEDDEFMSHPAIKKMRESVADESFHFLSEQRISCMLDGAWFQIPPAPVCSPTPSPSNAPASPSKYTKPVKWRFCKLSGTKKTLHWADFPDQLEKKPLFDQLTERLDLSIVTNVVTGLASPVYSTITNSPQIPNSPSATSIFSLSPPPGPPTAAGNLSNLSLGGGTMKLAKRPAMPVTDLCASLCFSVLGSEASSMLDLICVSQTQMSEWTDGLNLIMNRTMANKDSNEFVSSLTDIMSRLRVLDVQVDRLDLLDAPRVPPLPPNVDFFYEDVAGIGAGLVPGKSGLPSAIGPKDPCEGILPCPSTLAC